MTTTAAATHHCGHQRLHLASSASRVSFVKSARRIRSLAHLPSSRVCNSIKLELVVSNKASRWRECFSASCPDLFSFSASLISKRPLPTSCSLWPLSPFSTSIKWEPMNTIVATRGRERLSSLFFSRIRFPGPLLRKPAKDLCLRK
jgi:hypothetical protein